MIVAGGIKVGGFGSKPRELMDLVRVLTRGAEQKGANASDSEYIDEEWWSSEDDEDGGLDGRRGDDS